MCSHPFLYIWINYLFYILIQISNLLSNQNKSISLWHISDVIICKRWIAKLTSLQSEDLMVKKNRNLFFKYMLHVMHDGKLEGPFQELPVNEDLHDLHEQVCSIHSSHSQNQSPTIITLFAATLNFPTDSHLYYPHLSSVTLTECMQALYNLKFVTVMFYKLHGLVFNTIHYILDCCEF